MESIELFTDLKNTIDYCIKHNHPEHLSDDIFERIRFQLRIEGDSKWLDYSFKPNFPDDNELKKSMKHVIADTAGRHGISNSVGFI